MKNTLAVLSAAALIFGAVLVSAPASHAVKEKSDRVVHTPFGSTNRAAGRVVPTPFGSTNRFTGRIVPAPFGSTNRTRTAPVEKIHTPAQRLTVKAF